MSLLKRIMSPFVEFKEEENPEPAEDITPKAAETQSRPVNYQKAGASVPTASPSHMPSSSSSALPEYHKHFEDLIEDANSRNPLFQGTDFKEFIDSKIDVEAIADEGTRYRTAFNVLKRTGLTKERLVKTGQEYINIIESDLKGFEAAYLQQYKSDVEQKEQALQKKAEELQALTAKISALNQEMKQMSQEILQSKDKLNSNKNSFISAGENKKREIQSELEKIEQYF